VPLDSVAELVGSERFRERARELATRSIVMVKDVGGTVHDLRRGRPRIALVIYGEEDNRTIGQALAGELRAQGFAVATQRVWPASGPASYDSAAALVAGRGAALFAVGDKPVAGRGTIGVPAPLLALMRRSAELRPTILLSLGNPYLISRVPEVGSYLIAWRSNPVTEEAAARALAGVAPITGRLPIAIPPAYARGWGVMRRVP
jgi:beta-N-acetylhexosaminidase